jgi:hypothetical protein
MYSGFGSPADSAWQNSVSWLLFWILMAAVVCFIVNRSDKGPREGRDR